MPQILVVEDELDLASSLRDYLIWEGFTCDAVGNGQEALHYLRGNPTELILLDIRMPTMDGLEFMRKYTGHAAIIVISAWPLPESAPRSVTYFKKPLDLEELVVAVKRHCRVS